MLTLSGYFLFLFIYDQITTSKESEEIYSQGKSSNSSGSFGFGKTATIN